MPRTARKAPGGMVFHVLNRGVGRMRLFSSDADYAAFESILSDTLLQRPTRLLGYCLLPNHWHMVFWPQQEGELSDFMQRLTTTHVTNWQLFHDRAGQGHVYQGRFKSFPVETDEHFYQVMRYVERNALRAGLAATAEAWRWGSLWRRTCGSAADCAMLSQWPLPVGEKWLEYVNQPHSEAELKALRNSVMRGSPYGSKEWCESTASTLGLETTLRARGRPRH